MAELGREGTGWRLGGEGECQSQERERHQWQQHSQYGIISFHSDGSKYLTVFGEIEQIGEIEPIVLLVGYKGMEGG